MFLKWQDTQGDVHTMKLHRYTYFNGYQDTPTSKASESGGPELNWTTETFLTAIDLFTKKMCVQAMVVNRPSGSWYENFYNETGPKQTLAFWLHRERKWYVLAQVNMKYKRDACTSSWEMPFNTDSAQFSELFEKFEEFMLAEADAANGPSVWLLSQREPIVPPPS